MKNGFKVTAVTLAMSLLAWDAVAAERTHAVVAPVRIVVQEVVTNAACLLKHRYGQVCEGKFLEGSGPMLEKGAWLLLDFGQELHGSVQIGSGGAIEGQTLVIRSE
ncbi:MAG: hypothetical protein KBT68_01810 [bacterium]|nr:hypothetical protein [Candidatus Colisoma equi]